MSDLDFEELQKQCTAPIAGSTPYGEDPRNTEEFRAVKFLIGRYGDYRTKSTDSDVDEPKQWAAVIEHCRVILTQQGKDLRVLCWLCGALVSIHGIKGLQTGLAIMSHFLEDNPAALLPSDVRVKANAFSWLTEFIDFAVATYSKYVSNNLQALTGDETRTLTALSQEFERFYDVANENLADDRFDFKPLKSLRENLQGLLKLSESRMSVVDEEEAPAPKPVPSPPEKPPEEKPKPEPSPPPPPKVTPPPEPDPQERKATPESPAPQPDDNKPDKNTLLRDLAAWSFKLRTIAPQDPLAFKTLRLARWNPVTTQPPTLPKTRRTRLPGPRAEFTILKGREAKLAKREAFDHAAFLETCELWFNKYPYWLDLQYLAHMSAELAGLYDIRAVIVEETRTLLDRVGAEFMELEFKEGTPFADDTTRQWLRSILAAQPPKPEPLPVKVAPPAPVEPPAPAAVPVPVVSVQPSPALVLTTDKPSAPLEVFIHDRFQEIAAGKALEALKTTAAQIATEELALPRWRLLRVCGLAAAALPARKLLALTVLKEVRVLAEVLTIKSLQPAEFSEVVLALRDLGAEETLSQSEQNWISSTTEALRVAPAAVILREVAHS